MSTKFKLANIFDACSPIHMAWIVIWAVFYTHEVDTSYLRAILLLQIAICIFLMFQKLRKIEEAVKELEEEYDNSPK